jgi:hypothetical protein
MSKKTKPIDWVAIERDYRAGIMSIREIAKWYGNVTEAAIRKKAKAEGWTREAEPKHFERTPRVERAEITEIAGPAAMRPEQLTDRARGLAARLLDELDAVTAHIGEIEFMIETEETDPRRRAALQKAVSLGERAKTLKDVSLTMKTLTEAAAPEGKKAARQESANKASSAGRFGVPAAPGARLDG